MKILILLMVLVPYIAMAQFKGTYETLKIREVWYLCFNALTEHRRDIPKNDHALTCDCYVDKLRTQIHLGGVQHDGPSNPVPGDLPVYLGMPPTTQPLNRRQIWLITLTFPSSNS